MSWKMVKPLNDGDKVEYLAVYVLDWRPEWGKPDCGFVEDTAATDATDIGKEGE